MSQQDQVLDFQTWRELFQPAGTNAFEIRLFESFGKDLQDVEEAVHATGSKLV